jgi:uncharacterized protein (UPF0276 family)
MLLAINYSLEAAELLRQKRISVDRFKCPDWPWMIEEASQICPTAVHLNLTAGGGGMEAVDWELAERLLAQTDTPYVNLHLEPRRKDFPAYDNASHDPAQDEAVIARMIADVGAAAQRFGAERVIVENVPYRGTEHKVVRACVEPAIFSQVLEETGAGLLLDISHARIAAHALGIDEREYMERLPVERIKELHFTGIHRIEGRLQDHLEALPEDWPVLEWALGQMRAGLWGEAWLLALEYGGVGEKFAGRSEARWIEEQVGRLRGMV